MPVMLNIDQFLLIDSNVEPLIRSVMVPRIMYCICQITTCFMFTAVSVVSGANRISSYDISVLLETLGSTH